jgi:tetratricopeptide (TPR) repeat protein
VNHRVEELLQDASLARAEGDLDDALAFCEEAERAAQDDASRVKVADVRAAILISGGSFVEARAVLEGAVANFGQAVSPSTWGNLGFVLDKLREFEGAASAHRKCLAGLERDLGENHPRAAKQLADLAFSLIGLGHLDEAEALLREGVARFEKQPDREPLWHARALSNLGSFLCRSRNTLTASLECLDRSEGLRDAASLRINGRVIREGFPEDFEALLLANRAEVVVAQGKTEEAAALQAKSNILLLRLQERRRDLGLPQPKPLSPVPGPTDPVRS